MRRPTLALAMGAALVSAACSMVVEHRDFTPDMPGMTVETPGQRGVRAARHVVPPDAIDDRSAVLVYSTGAHLVDPSGGRFRLRSAEVRMHFRARNDELVPLVVEPQNVLLVVAPKSANPAVFLPAWIEVDEKENTSEDGSIVVAPRSTASWDLVFTLPASEDPLRRVRSFLVSWTYRLGAMTFEERTRFVSVMRRGNGWSASSSMFPGAQ
jgi:hypothetical protein